MMSSQERIVQEIAAYPKEEVRVIVTQEELEEALESEPCCLDYHLMMDELQNNPAVTSVAPVGFYIRNTLFCFVKVREINCVSNESKDYIAFLWDTEKTINEILEEKKT